jgi:hypothetical protein
VGAGSVTIRAWPGFHTALPPPSPRPRRRQRSAAPTCSSRTCGRATGPDDQGKGANHGELDTHPPGGSRPGTTPPSTHGRELQSGRPDLNRPPLGPQRAHRRPPPDGPRSLTGMQRRNGTRLGPHPRGTRAAGLTASPWESQTSHEGRSSYRLKPPRSQAPVVAFDDPGAPTGASDTWPAHGLKRAWPRDVWGFKSMDRTGTLDSSP